MISFSLRHLICPVLEPVASGGALNRQRGKTKMKRWRERCDDGIVDDG